MNDTTTLENDLANFTGTEAYHRFSPLSKLVLTDGANYLAKKAGAYWLMDIIASYQNDLAEYDFQVWKLTVKNGKGVVVCEDGNDSILITQKIPHTDFPMAEITLFCQNNVILLTSEY